MFRIMDREPIKWATLSWMMLSFFRIVGGSVNSILFLMCIVVDGEGFESKEMSHSLEDTHSLPGLQILETWKFKQHR